MKRSFALTVLLAIAALFSSNVFGETVQPNANIKATLPVAWLPGDHPGLFTITRTPSTPMTSAFRVYYSIGGTASNGVDYLRIPEYVDLLEGVASAAIPIFPIEKPIPAESKTVVLTLRTTNMVIMSILPTNSATVVIKYNYTNQPPTIDLFNPTNNSSFLAGANVTLKAESKDIDGFVREVKFFAGSDLLGVALPNGSNNLFSMVWSNVAAGQKTLSAVATDNLGVNQTSRVVNISVTNKPANLNPFVRIVTPTNNSVFIAPATVTILAESSDPDGWVRKLQFFSGTNLLGVIENPPPGSLAPIQVPQIVWTNVPPGNYPLSVTATDNLGASTKSAVVNIVVRELLPTNKPPVVAIYAPSNNAKFMAPARIDIWANAADPDGWIDTVTFFAGDVKLGTITNNPEVAYFVNPFHISWTNVAAGTYTLTAIATDNLGAKRISEPVHVTVTNYVAPPVVRITSPTNGAIFSWPATIPIQVKTPESIVAFRVEFFASGVSLGVVSNAPYTFVWSNAVPGAYRLVAKAYVTTNNPAVSEPVEIAIRRDIEKSFVSRRLPTWYVPGAKLVVQLQAKPATNTLEWTAEDLPPAEWKIAWVSEGGRIEAGKVKYGPFTGNTPRILSYQVIAPAAAKGPKSFFGTATADGLTTIICGASSINPAPPHPADLNPTNFVITSEELAAYNSAWRKAARWPQAPNPIPINYVSRAGFLLAQGGGYAISTNSPTPFPPMLWVPTNNPGGPIIILDQPNSTYGFPVISNNVGLAVRSITTNSEGLSVSIAVTPPSGSFAYAVEDRPPYGYVVSVVGQDGAYDPVTRKVKWGVFVNSAARTLTYTLKRVWTIDVIVPEPAFAGTASFDGCNVSITGKRAIVTPGILTMEATAGAVVRCGFQEGTPMFSFPGEPGVPYLIEGSEDLMEWIPVEMLFNDDGVLDFSDSTQEAFSARFYRAIPMR